MTTEEIGHLINLDEALRHADELFATKESIVPWHVALERDEPHPVPIAVTDELAFDRAITLYRQGKARRAESGLAPLIVTTEALQQGAELASHDEDVDGDAFFARREGDERWTPQIEAALDRLGEIAGRDPMTILHRLGPDELDALGGDEEAELDEDALGIDDVREAFHEGLANRAALLDEARRTGLRAWISPLRTYDEASALSASSRADALWHLGFGGFNDSPSPHEHASVWARWGRLYGAEPVAVTNDAIEGVLARPVSTRRDLVALAGEVILYDREVLAPGLLTFVGWLYRNASLHCWWD